ncbi:MAG: acylphosphatase [Thermodesulfobacteriota bacterium]|nr:MAG: acylphosphatase [Thermodesulfobacteriota bacterium]
MDKKRVHLIIYGKVQGVFFRASTKDKAVELGLKGFVRNKPDGTVEVISEGSGKQLQELVAWCHEGPDHSIIELVKLDWQPYIEEFEEFTII